MKKIFYLMVALAAIFTITSCQDDELDGRVKNPVQAGDEISFGSSLPEEIQSRTIYGNPDPNTKSFPVYWRDGDEIAIYCPQASMPLNKLARYRISAPTEMPFSSTATAVTKIGDAGLQWGEDGLYKFYAFYPSKSVKGNETDREFDLNVPVNQQVKSFRQNGKDWQADVDTELALMYAYRGQYKQNIGEGQSINLKFKPLSTILEIVLQGPANTNETLTLTNINVETLDGTPIVGDFKAMITAGSDTEESDESTVTFYNTKDGIVTNNLSIPCSWEENGKIRFVELENGGKLYVKAFLLPTQEVDSKNLKITVSTTKGATHMTLVDKDGKSFKILSQKVNRATLPPLKVNFETAYWMNSLDPDIYLTELSIPGSKMTFETSANGAGIPYQDTDIEQQYKDGVRAFIIQTYRETSGIWPTTETMKVARTGQNLGDVLTQISNYLSTSAQNGKNEFAFALITYQSGDGNQGQWMNLLQNVINGMSEDVIYKKEITPETTLRDVFGKIVVKCNYNSLDMISRVETAPMLYTLWETPYVEGGLPMTWNDPHSTANLTWLYQEVTTVLDEEKNTCEGWSGVLGHVDKYTAESSAENKKKYISELFEKSLQAYKNEDHSTWFMNDLGGCYSWCTVSHDLTHQDHNTNQNFDVVRLTKELNPLAIKELQARKENAGLGLIFMNYANRGTTGQEYESDKLLQTIIDNNFKFALRKKVNGANKSYNAEYMDGGDVWK